MARRWPSFQGFIRRKRLERIFFRQLSSLRSWRDFARVLLFQRWSREGIGEEMSWISLVSRARIKKKWRLRCQISLAHDSRQLSTRKRCQAHQCMQVRNDITLHCLRADPRSVSSGGRIKPEKCEAFSTLQVLDQTFLTLARIWRVEFLSLRVALWGSLLTVSKSTVIPKGMAISSVRA